MKLICLELNLSSHINLDVSIVACGFIAAGHFFTNENFETPKIVRIFLSRFENRPNEKSK